MPSPHAWSVVLRQLHGIALVSALAVAPAAAQEPPSVADTADRPGFADSPVVLGRGHVQVEVGFTTDHEDDGAQSLETRIWPQLELHAGVLPRLDAIVYWDGVISSTLKDESGLDEDTTGGADVRVGIKLGLLQRSRVDAALVAYVNVPAGSEALSSRYADPFTRFVWAAVLSERVGLSGTADLKEVHEEDGHVHAKPAASLQVAAAVSSGLESFVALVSEPPALGSKPSVVSVETGLVLQVSDRTQLDVWMSNRVAGGPDHWFIGAGYIRRLR